MAQAVFYPVAFAEALVKLIYKGGLAPDSSSLDFLHGIVVEPVLHFAKLKK